MDIVSEYEVQSDFMIRVPRFAAYAEGSDSSRLTWDAKQIAVEFCSDPHLRKALTLASPTTANALMDEMEAGGPEHISARLNRTLRRYWIRAHARPTPFGLFSGIGFGVLSDAGVPEVKLSPVREVLVRPDLGWVAHVIANRNLLDDEHDTWELPVRVNPFLYRAGDRFFLPNTNILAEKDSFTVDFRATEPVEKVLGWVAEGGTRRQIESLLEDAYPEIDENSCKKLIGQLFDQHVLADHPLPSMAVETLLSEMIPPSKHSLVKHELEQIDEQVKALCTPDAVVNGIEEVVAKQRQLSAGYEGEVLSVESAISLTREELCQEIGRSVEKIANLLITIGAPWSRLSHLVDYENAFIERFGAMAEVPLLKLLGDEVGLGAPDGYAFPTTGFRAKHDRENTSARENTLKELLNMTMLLGQKELVLTTDQIEALHRDVDRNGTEPPSSMDLFVTVHGKDEQISSGQHQVVFRGTMCDGGRSWGRFAGLFDDRRRNLTSDFFAWESAQHQTERMVQLSYFAATGKGANVARSETVADLEICVNCAATLPSKQQVSLEDILVGTGGDGFYLRWAVTGERIRVIQNHLLNYTMAPNPVRFLMEVSEDGIQPLFPFDWDGCGSMPFLPRVRVDNLVLFPARWLLSSRPFSQVGLTDSKIFLGELAKLRSKLSIPRHVYLTENDNRLLLDLDCRADADLLRDELSGEPGEIAQVVLEETLFEPDELIIKDEIGQRYHSEFVFTLRRKPEKGMLSASNKSRLRQKCLAPTQFGLMPDTEWLSAEMYGKQSTLDRLVGELPDLVNNLDGLVNRWFFIRYAAGGDHLRLRVRPRSFGFSETLALLKDAGRHLVENETLTRFNIVDYRAETNRYGGLTCLEAAFETFEASSRYAAEIASGRIDSEIDGDVLGAYLIDEILGATGLVEQVLAEIGEVKSRHPSRARFRETKRLLGALLEPTGYDQDPVAAKVRENLESVRIGFLAAVKRHGDLVARAESREELVNSCIDVCHSVIHMHLNRCVPVSKADEPGSYSLLAVAKRALAQRARALKLQEAAR